MHLNLINPNSVGVINTKVFPNTKKLTCNSVIKTKEDTNTKARL